MSRSRSKPPIRCRGRRREPCRCPAASRRSASSPRTRARPSCSRPAKAAAPSDTDQFTAAPTTGEPEAVVARTLSGRGSVERIAPTCPLPDATARSPILLEPVTRTMAVSSRLAALAVSLTTPGVFAVSAPLPSTLATVGFDEVHSTWSWETRLPNSSRGETENDATSPMSTVSLVGLRSSAVAFPGATEVLKVTLAGGGTLAAPCPACAVVIGLATVADACRVRRPSRPASAPRSGRPRRSRGPVPPPRLRRWRWRHDPSRS